MHDIDIAEDVGLRVLEARYAVLALGPETALEPVLARPAAAEALGKRGLMRVKNVEAEAPRPNQRLMQARGTVHADQKRRRVGGQRSDGGRPHSEAGLPLGRGDDANPPRRPSLRRSKERTQ